MPVKPKSEVTEIEILEISQGEIAFAAVGVSPYYFNRMSEKAKRTLLLGGRRKTDADKAANLKHDPPAEYRDSVYRWAADDRPTRLKIPSASFKGVMSTAALVLPGTRKSEIGRLVWVVDQYVDFYGIPLLAMDVVRSADINKTPDIRTRAIIPAWAAIITVRFVEPNLTRKAIGNLMAAGGVVAGVGDYRQEKGKGNFGQFRLADMDDEELQSIMRSGARKAQDEALLNYRCFDPDTQDLLDWYHAEITRRGRDGAEEKPRKEKVNGRGATSDTGARRRPRSEINA